MFKMLSLKEVREAKEQLSQIEKSQDRFNKNVDRQLEEIRGKYRSLRYEIDDKEREAKKGVGDTKKNVNSKYEASKENSISVLSEFDNNLKFYKIWNHRDCQIGGAEVYYYDYVRGNTGYIVGDKQKFFYNPIGLLVEDDFKKILIYVTKNSKPKNKYDLIACGDTRLTGNLLNIPCSYGIDAYVHNSNIRELIKSFTTEEGAVDYFKRNKDKILKKFLEEHKEVEEKYKEFIQAIESNESIKRDWDIAYLENQKYYYENNYSNGIETEEYKEICKKLEGLNND